MYKILRRNPLECLSNEINNEKTQFSILVLLLLLEWYKKYCSYFSVRFVYIA